MPLTNKERTRGQTLSTLAGGSIKRRMDSYRYTMSRWLAYILRYGAADRGIYLWPGGWADLNQVATLRKTSPEDITCTVLTDADCRFQILWHGGGWWIRATPVDERTGGARFWGANHRLSSSVPEPPMPELWMVPPHWLTAQEEETPPSPPYPPGLESGWEAPPLAYHIGRA